MRTQFSTDSQWTILQLFRGNGQESILSWQRLARSMSTHATRGTTQWETFSGELACKKRLLRNRQSRFKAMPRLLGGHQCRQLGSWSLDRGANERCDYGWSCDRVSSKTGFDRRVPFEAFSMRV